MTDEPKTGAAVMALPEIEPPFYKITCGNCRHTIMIPKARKGHVRPYSGDSILFVRDSEGTAWSPVLTEDGWRRQRQIY